MTLRQIVDRVGAAFWTVPAASALLAAALAVIVARIDHGLGEGIGLAFAGGPASARTILSVVASSVLSFAALTFSITMLALQLASNQFSPRVLGSMLKDRWSRYALGVFVGTFVFALFTLREVRGGSDPFVPGLGVSATLLLALVAVGTLTGFIHQMTQSLRVGTIIDRIHQETCAAIDAWYDPDTSPSTGRLVDGPVRTVPAPRAGVLTWIDHGGIVSRARERALSVRVLTASGSWVVEGQSLMAVHGSDDEAGAFARYASFGGERDVARDPAYGFRQLVDIAERALSPGVNDPTTAVQCLDRLHSLLRRLVSRDLAVGDTVVDWVTRLRVPVPDWTDYLALACDEIRHWGADSLRVHRRLEALLADLGRVAGDERAEAVVHQQARLRARRTGRVAQEWDAWDGGLDPAERPPIAP